MIIKREQTDTKYEEALGKPVPYVGKASAPLGNFASTKFEATCPGCGTLRKYTKFLPVPNKYIGWTIEGGRRRTMLCFHCVLDLHDKILKSDPERNVYRALFKLCAYLGYYYDDELAQKIYTEKHYWEQTGEPIEYVPRVILYIKVVTSDEKYKDKNFYDDPTNCNWERTQRVQTMGDGEIGLDDQSITSRRQIVNVYHYDPFEYEPMVERRRLYEDLLTLIDDSFADDLVKQKAAVVLCLSYRNLDKVNNTLSDLMSTPESVKDNADVIKKLTDQKQKETSMISSFAKDNGFSERYAAGKAKGSGTLSAVVRDMEIYGYDEGVVNMFDIEMAGGMRQASDISAESIFKQLNLSDSDYAKMVKEQGELIREMQTTMAQQAEALRLLKEKHLKAELLEEYRQELISKGIELAEVEGLVNDELKVKPIGTTEIYQTVDEMMSNAGKEEDEKPEEEAG